jgi:hypothetical protein
MLGLGRTVELNPPNVGFAAVGPADYSSDVEFAAVGALDRLPLFQGHVRVVNAVACMKGKKMYLLIILRNADCRRKDGLVREACPLSL